jgi:nucleoside-diphosphate-sugar epimerase
MQLAEIVRDVTGTKQIDVVPTDDLRSYQVSSKKILREIGFAPKRTIEDAVRDLKNAFDAKRLNDPLNNPMYFNIKRMQEVGLQ